MFPRGLVDLCPSLLATYAMLLLPVPQAAAAQPTHKLALSLFAMYLLIELQYTCRIDVPGGQQCSAVLPMLW